MIIDKNGPFRSTAEGLDSQVAGARKDVKYRTGREGSSDSGNDAEHGFFNPVRRGSDPGPLG